MEFNDSSPNDTNYGKGYVFSPTLSAFMKDMLHYFSIEGNNTNAEDGKTINKRNLDRRKRYILDKYIFESMANLIFFFEYLKKHPDLRDVFEDDIKELFGYIRVKPGKHEGHSKYNAEYVQRHAILNRFLGSLLHWDINEDPYNFRWELVEELFDIFWRFLPGNTLMGVPTGKDGQRVRLGKEIPPALIDSKKNIDYFASIFANKYSESGNKTKDRNKPSNRSIQFDPL